MPRKAQKEVYSSEDFDEVSFDDEITVVEESEGGEDEEEFSGDGEEVGGGVSDRGDFYRS